MAAVDSKRVWKVSPLHTTYMELIFFKAENQKHRWKTHYEPFLGTSAIKPEMQTVRPICEKVQTRSLRPNWKLNVKSLKDYIFPARRGPKGKVCLV